MCTYIRMAVNVNTTDMRRTYLILSHPFSTVLSSCSGWNARTRSSDRGGLRVSSFLDTAVPVHDLSSSFLLCIPRKLKSARSAHNSILTTQTVLYVELESGGERPRQAVRYFRERVGGIAKPSEADYEALLSRRCVESRAEQYRELRALDFLRVCAKDRSDVVASQVKGNFVCQVEIQN